MRSRIVAVFLPLAVVAVVTVACSAGLNPADHAKRAVEAFLRTRFQRCGATFFAKTTYHVEGTGLFGWGGHDVDAFVELGDTNVTVESEELSKADLLNGLRWRGRATFTPATRIYREDLKAWGGWIARSNTSIDVTQDQNGDWFVSNFIPWGPLDDPVGTRLRENGASLPPPVDCAAIPR